MNAVLERPIDSGLDEKQKRLAEQSRERREKEQMSTAERQSAAAASDEGDEPIVEVSRDKMLNLPEDYGLASLHIRLKALPSKSIPDFSKMIFEKWPPIFYIASYAPLLPGGMIDIDGVADYYTRVNDAAAKAENEQSGAEAATGAVYSADDIGEMLESANNSIEQYIEGITDTVWLMAGGCNDALTRDGLRDLLHERCTIVDWVILPRVLLRANSVGGGYVDDIEKRFTKPS